MAGESAPAAGCAEPGSCVLMPGAPLHGVQVRACDQRALPCAPWIGRARRRLARRCRWVCRAQPSAADAADAAVAAGGTAPARTPCASGNRKDPSCSRRCRSPPPLPPMTSPGVGRCSQHAAITTPAGIAGVHGKTPTSVVVDLLSEVEPGVALLRRGGSPAASAAGAAGPAVAAEVADTVRRCRPGPPTPPTVPSPPPPVPL